MCKNKSKVRKIGKKGMSHVDWAISLSIFLLYISWFFIFVLGQGKTQTDFSPYITTIESNLKDNIFFQVRKTPIITESNITDINKPIIVRFNGYNETNCWMDRYFVIDDNYLFFITNLSKGINNDYIVCSNENYTKEEATTDIYSTENETTITEFRTIFKDNLIDEVFYHSKRIYNFNINIKGININQLNYDKKYKKWPILSKYKIISAINNTYYIFAYNPSIYSLIRSNDEQKKDVEIYFTISNYTDYYFNQLTQGSLDDVSSITKDTNSLFIYNNITNDSLLIETSGVASFTIKKENNNITIYIETNITKNNDFWYSFIFFDNKEKRLDRGYKTIRGFEHVMNGINIQKIESFLSQDYNEMRKELKLPETRNFMVEVWNRTSVLYKLGKETNESNIYVKRIRSYILYKNSSKQNSDIIIGVW